MSVVERLVLEECLLRHDDRSWMVVGHHDATSHKHLRGLGHENHHRNAIIVLGIGGKPEKLLNLELVKEDSVLAVKRFSGGGTVVLDFDSIWTTLIGRKSDFPDIEAFPRPIMKWTADALFGPMFDRLAKANGSREEIMEKEKPTMILDTKSCAVENTGRVITIPNKVVKVPDTAPREPSVAPSDLTFALREHDYVLGHRKMGGNAQAITHPAWLHHTSFLWDFSSENMSYLQLPEKRPAYRQDRDHNDFLVKLCECFPNLKKTDFYTHLKAVCEEAFQLQTVNVREAIKVVDQVGGLDAWFRTKSRTRILKDL